MKFSIMNRDWNREEVCRGRRGGGSGIYKIDNMIKNLGIIEDWRRYKNEY